MASPLYADTRGRILSASAEILRERTFGEVSLADIASRAQISKGTLYYYYNNKNDILFDIADQYLEGLSDSLLEWVDDRHKDTSPLRLARYVLERGVFNDAGGLRLHLISYAVSGDEEMRKKLLAKYDHFKTILRDRLEQRITTLDGEYLAWLLLTVMDGILVQTQLHNEDFDAEAFIETTAKLIAGMAGG